MNIATEQVSGVIFSKELSDNLAQLLFLRQRAFFEAEKIERELNLQLPNDDIEYIFAACDSYIDWLGRQIKEDITLTSSDCVSFLHELNQVSNGKLVIGN